MSVAHDPEVLSVKEAAERLRISEHHARNLIARGELPHIRFGRTIRIPRIQLDRLLAGDGEERS